MPKAVGICLAGEHPTAAEKLSLDKWAKTELGTYRLQRTVAYDLKKRQRIVRLDAIQLAEPLFPTDHLPHTNC